MHHLVVHPTSGCNLSLGRAFVAEARLSGGRSMTLRVRDLHAGEAEELVRMTRSRTLGAGLVRRAQIVQHAVDGLNAPEIAASLDVIAKPWFGSGSSGSTRGGCP